MMNTDQGLINLMVDSYNQVVDSAKPAVALRCVGQVLSSEFPVLFSNAIQLEGDTMSIVDETLDVKSEASIRAKLDLFASISSLEMYNRLLTYLQTPGAKLERGKRAFYWLNKFAMNVIGFASEGDRTSLVYQGLCDLDNSLVNEFLENDELKLALENQAEMTLEILPDVDVQIMKEDIVQTKIDELKKDYTIVDGQKFTSFDLKLDDIIAEASFQVIGAENDGTQDFDKIKTSLVNIARDRLAKNLSEQLLQKDEYNQLLIVIYSKEIKTDSSRLEDEQVISLVMRDEGIRMQLAYRIIDICGNTNTNKTDSVKKAILKRNNTYKFPDLGSALVTQEAELIANLSRIIGPDISRLREFIESFDLLSVLTPEEIKMLKMQLPNVEKREQKMKFMKAEQALRLRLITEIDQEDLVELWIQENIEKELMLMSQESIDSALIELGYAQGVIKSPQILNEKRESILTTARRILQERIVKINNESIADYSGVGLCPEFVPFETSNNLPDPSTGEVVSLGRKKIVKLGVRDLTIFPEYQVTYPQSVIDAIALLVEEYDIVFKNLVARNKENEYDYQYGQNLMVQIDMTGLSTEYLQQAASLPPSIIVQDLRTRTFEIENSIADYQYLQAVGVDIRPVLNNLRENTEKKIILLATTEQKYQDIRVAEFGQPQVGSEVDPELVMKVSGFDALWGPEQFRLYQDEIENKYLFYVRASLSKNILKGSKRNDAQPSLLDDAVSRRLVKANAITFNIDNSNWPTGSAERINDTKMYMAPMGMGYVINTINDLKSPTFSTFSSGKTEFRLKPALESYGGYGQLRGDPGTPSILKQLNTAMRSRGPYVVQPEMPYSTITDEQGNKFIYIDRNYFGFINGKLSYIGGERTLMPINSQEARSGRVHANTDAIIATISDKK